MKFAKLVALVCVITCSVGRAAAQDRKVILQWNQMVQSLYGTGASNAQRTFAMVHIAMFDAINSIEETHTPYRFHVPGSRGAAPEAAAAQAAHDVLHVLFPAQQPAFDKLLAAQLAGLPNGQARQGAEIGQQVAQAILNWRQDDGWPAAITPDPTYVLPPIVGDWQPTPPANSSATFTFYAKVKPFAILSSTQFLPPPPPTLSSERYATDLNETKTLGSAGSLLRTSEQTLMAQLIAGINTSLGFFQLWNAVAGTVAQNEHLSFIDTARLFVLVNVSIHDGLETSFASKFVYGMWRPVTAIRRAGEDLNPATDADPAWTPLLGTPPYPTYPGNVACLAAAAARSLQLVLGRDDVPFSLTWPRTMGLPSVTRDFNGFGELAEMEARSRIHGGIHFQFDSDASQEVCPKVAEFTHSHFMTPRP